mmetsp:Transcript_45426/g.117559  ORF Transcript_45426/g.117559 Transcript_45426/m.117559 type:complete len:131 (-) Transcript_45426:4-396(-)
MRVSSVLVWCSCFLLPLSLLAQSQSIGSLRSHKEEEGSVPPSAFSSFYSSNNVKTGHIVRPHEYVFYGPYPIGKGEVDADPSYYQIAPPWNLHKVDPNKVVIESELLDGGKGRPLHWRWTVPAHSNSQLA